MNFFNQEYPQDDISCWLTSGSPRFNTIALQQMKAACASFPPEEGSLQDIGRAPNRYMKPEHRSRPSFIRSSEPWVQIWEFPTVGHSYILSEDVAKGEMQTKGDDTDRNAILVWRKAYTDQHRQYHPTFLAARVKPPNKVTPDVQAPWVDRLSRYYGGAPVVVENNGPGYSLLQHLKILNVPIYEHEVFKTNVTNAARKVIMGWDTNRDTRIQLIDELDRRIRENLEPETLGGVVILCPHLIGECLSFVRSGAQGKAQARDGCHDDDVISAGIGLVCIDGAMLYRELVVEDEWPEEVREMLEGSQTYSGSYLL